MTPLCIKKEIKPVNFNPPNIILRIRNLYSSFPKVLGMRSIHRHTFPFEDVCERAIEIEGWLIEKTVWCILNNLRLYASKQTIVTTTVLFVTYVSARESKDTTVKDTASLNGKPAAYPL